MSLVKFSIKKILTITFISLAALVLLAAIVLYLSFGTIFKHVLEKGEIQKNFKKNYGLELRLNGAKVSTKPSLSVVLTVGELGIFDPLLGKELLNISDAKVGVRLFPLIFKTVRLTDIQASHIGVDVSRDKKGVFNFEKFFKAGGDLNFDIKNTKIDIKKYILGLDDKMLDNTIVLSGENLAAKKFDPKKRIVLSTKGRLSIKEGNAGKISTSTYDINIDSEFPLRRHFSKDNFKFNALVANLSLKPYESYIKQFVSKDVVSVSGLLNFKLSSSREAAKAPLVLEARLNGINLAFVQNEKLATIKALNEARVLSYLDVDKNDINIENLTYKTKDVDVTIKGKVFNYKKIKEKKLAASIETTLKNTSARAAVELIPDSIKTPEDSIRKIKKHKINATADGSIRFVGSLKKPKLDGKMTFKDFYFGDDPKAAYRGKGFCEFNGNTMTTNAALEVTDGSSVDIIGLVELFHPKPKSNFSIKSSPRVDAKMAQEITLKFKDIFGFELGPIPMMKIAGMGEIAIETSGAKDDSRVHGYVNLKGMSGSFDGINAKATDVVGQILFKGDVISFDGIRAKLNSAPFRVDGNSTTSGDLDITFTVLGLKLSDGTKMCLTSPLVKDQLQVLNIIKSTTGTVNTKLNLKGNVKKLKDFTDLSNGQTANILEPTLRLEFLGASALTEPNIEVKNLRGTVDFAKNVFDIKTTGRLYNSDFEVVGTATPQKGFTKIDLNLNSKSFALGDYLTFTDVGLKTPLTPEQRLQMEFLKKLNILCSLKASAKGEVPFGTSAKLDLRKVQLGGAAYPLNSKNSAVKFSSGDVKFRGQKVLFDNLRFNLWGSDGLVTGSVDKIFDDVKRGGQVWNLKVACKNFALSKLNAPQAQKFLPEKFKKAFDDFENIKGTLSLNVDISNGTMGGEVSFSNASAFNKSKKINLELKSGDVKMVNSKLVLSALNATFGDMPVYLDGSVAAFDSGNPYYDINLSASVSERTADSIINPNLAYPIKVKGEFGLKGKLKGYGNNYNVTGRLSLNPQSDISYMGASLGDVDTRREVRLNANFKENVVKVNSVELLKYLYSQNNRPSAMPIARASGSLFLKGRDLYLQDFAVRTLSPAPAGIFNVIFKKSILKQGNFTCNLNLNGIATAPRVVGNIALSDINIPLYSSQIKDADFEMKGDTIYGTLAGKGLDSDIKILVEMKNSFVPPYVFKKLEIDSTKVSLDKILDELSLVASMQKGTGAPSSQIVFNPRDIIILNGTAKAKEVSLYKVKASNMDIKFSQGEDGIFKTDDMVFDVAGGKIRTKGSFNFDKARLSLSSKIIDCDANSLSSAFLGISNQLFGVMNGEFSLTGSQLHTTKGLETVSANAQFEVKNGKMPKLGSLEYLLRAGNFFKSGVLGLSINNIIDLVTPFKTGDFKSVKGNLVVENGKAKTLEIYSKGENLSLYAHGTYDLTTGYADIELLGRLSRKVSNLLGPVGNASINSLLGAISGGKMDTIARNELVQNINRIPLIELSNDDVRIFVVKVLGDLNKEGYVKSFNWVDKEDK